MERTNDFHGLDLNTVYDVAHQFLSDKIEKAFHPSFDERVYLSALSLQSKFGKYDSSKTSGVGILDFSGQQRINQWKALGDMETEEAKSEFIKQIKKMCPMFPTYLAAYSKQTSGPVAPVSDADANASLPLQQSQPLNNLITDKVQSTERNRGNIPLQNELEIRSALNAQTKQQFEAYAVLHYPDDPEKRAELIAELQERHFHEYTAYIEQQKSAAHQRRPAEHTSAAREASPEFAADVEKVVEGGWVYTDGPGPQRTSLAADAGIPSPQDSISAGNEPEATVLAQCSASSDDVVAADDEAPSDESFVRVPSMWTRGEVVVFKENLANTKDAIVSIGCGEMITIRVPTYPSGSSIVWEFATDDYDIGFGLFFEWSRQDGGEKSVGGSESNTFGVSLIDEAVPTNTGDQREIVSDPNVQCSTTADQTVSLEGNTETRLSEEECFAQPLVDEIIPVFRRSCHQEVFCGTHPYPGPGTYLFKFDNSYSLWRSKVLYYRVYYTC